VVWRRLQTGGLVREEARFRPWLVLDRLDDLRHLGAAVVHESAAKEGNAPFTFREVEGPSDSLRYVVSACDGRALQQAILSSARRRLGRAIERIADLPDQFYQVGAVEQYLTATGRVCFRGMAYADLHRLQFDLETTALSPRHGRIARRTSPACVRDQSRAWSRFLPRASQDTRCWSGRLRS